MTEIIGSVSIYRKGEEPQLLLMHYAPFFDARGSYKGNGCWGDLEPVKLSVFETRGLEIVRSSFRAFAARRLNYDDLNEKRGFDLWTASKRQRFFREHADVDVSERENGDLWLDPTKPRSVGFSGMSDENKRIIVPKDATSAHFYACVLEALKL